MRSSRLLCLAVFLPLLAPCPGRCEEEPCRTVGAMLSVYPALDVRRSQAPPTASPDGRQRPGCRVHASGPAAMLAGEVDPAEAVRRYFHGTGWEEDARPTADGPGTTSFAFRKAGMSCRTSAGARSRLEGVNTSGSDRYGITVECVPRSD